MSIKEASITQLHKVKEALERQIEFFRKRENFFYNKRNEIDIELARIEQQLIELRIDLMKVKHQIQKAEGNL